MVKLTVDNLTIEGTAEEVVQVITSIHGAQPIQLDGRELAQGFADGMKAPDDFEDLPMPERADYVLLTDGRVVYIINDEDADIGEFDVALAGGGSKFAMVIDLEDIKRILDDADNEDEALINTQWAHNREVGLLNDGI